MPKFKQKGRMIEHGGIIAVLIALSRLVLRRAGDADGTFTIRKYGYEATRDVNDNVSIGRCAHE